MGAVDYYQLRSMSEVALKLLSKYYDAQLAIIYEYGGNIWEGEEDLDNEFAQYETLISRIMGEASE